MLFIGVRVGCFNDIDILLPFDTDSCDLVLHYILYAEVRVGHFLDLYMLLLASEYIIMMDVNYCDN